MNKILRSKSGASLMFVLAAMLLLMAIGVSAITAAGLSFGASIDQREWSQLDIYVSSMERTMKAALEANDMGDCILDAKALTSHLLKLAYDSGDGPYSFEESAAVNLTAQSPDGDADYRVVISGEFNVQVFEPIIIKEWVAVEGGEPGEPGDPDDPDDPDAEPEIEYVEVQVDRTPKIVMISGEIVVTQTTRYQAPDEVIHTMITSTTYRLNGVVIEEDPEYDRLSEMASDSDMLIVFPGALTVMKHEAIDE